MPALAVHSVLLPDSVVQMFVLSPRCCLSQLAIAHYLFYRVSLQRAVLNSIPSLYLLVSIPTLRPLLLLVPLRPIQLVQNRNPVLRPWLVKTSPLQRHQLRQSLRSLLVLLVIKRLLVVLPLYFWV